MAKTGKARAARGNGKAKKAAAPKKQRERKARAPKSAEQLSDEQRQSLLFSYKRKLKPLLVTEKNAKTAVKQVYEQAKKEGLTKEEIELAIALETEEGEEKISSKFERIARVARWMGVKIGAQLDLFGGAKQSAAEKAHEDGKRAALDDQPAKPPEHLGQKLADDWLSGWNEGRKSLNVERASGFKPLSESVPEVVSDLIPPAAPEPAQMPAAA